MWQFLLEVTTSLALRAVLASFRITRAVAPVKAVGLLSERMCRLIDGFSRGESPLSGHSKNTSAGWIQPPLGRLHSGDSPPEKQERNKRQQRHSDQKLKPVQRKYPSERSGHVVYSFPLGRVLQTIK